MTREPRHIVGSLRTGSPRAILRAGWATFILTIIVCAAALHLTRLQYENAEQVARDVEREIAGAARGHLEAFLDAREAAALEQVQLAIGPAAAAPADGGGPRVEDPLVEQTFSILRDGTVRLGGERPLRWEERLEDVAALPPALEAALSDAALSAGPEAPDRDAIAALRALLGSGELAPRWRLRAEAAIAALLTRAGATEEAAEAYTSLLAEHALLLGQGATPGYLQLSLARAEALVDLGRRVELEELVRAAVRSLQEGGIASSVEERLFFLEEVGALLERAGGAGTPGNPGTPGSAGSVLALVEQCLRDERQKAALSTRLEALREWVLVKSRLAPYGLETAQPERHLDVAGAAGGLPAYFVWRALPPSPGAELPEVVGFTARLDVLEREGQERLGAIPSAGHLALHVLPAEGASTFHPLEPLSGERRLLVLGIESGPWKARLGKARRPFLLAGGLIGGLMLLLLLGLLAFLRGVNREILLSRMKTEFVANVSHELKTPLSLIRLFGETLLLDRAQDPEQRRKYYGIITRESERLTHLIANLLNFASIESGRKSYELKPLDPGEVVRDTYEAYRLHLDDNGFEHGLEVEPGLPRLKADRDALAQSLINLLDNAVKYSRERKSVRVSVTAKNGEVALTVEDQGIGILPEDRERVWEDYYRARDARGLGTRGSGLGLSLVLHIVKAHGGRVELESTHGVGSRFRLIFPAAGEGEPDSQTQSLANSQSPLSPSPAPRSEKPRSEMAQSEMPQSEMPQSEMPQSEMRE